MRRMGGGDEPPLSFRLIGDARKAKQKCGPTGISRTVAGVAVAQFASDLWQRPAGRRRRTARDHSHEGVPYLVWWGSSVGSLGDRVILRWPPVWYG